MKKLAITFIFVLAVTSVVSAAEEYLTCDLYPDPNIVPVESQVMINGVIQLNPDGSSASILVLDVATSRYRLFVLTNQSPGPYLFMARWRLSSTGRWSEWSDPLDAAKPSGISNVNVVEE